MMSLIHVSSRDRHAAIEKTAINAARFFHCIVQPGLHLDLLIDRLTRPGIQIAHQHLRACVLRSHLVHGHFQQADLPAPLVKISMTVMVQMRSKYLKSLSCFLVPQNRPYNGTFVLMLHDLNIFMP